ncbi:derlin 2 [Rhynchophorus ferrugineus]|uniref:Derlin n=1 Tax=Rhynchophorus ferrugineus TaxID=354439 RepID=A0A834M2Z6_RHYFE|nr:hypothetical protein GWI33_020824 [Rhynchophorus ferrugineus]
MAYQTLRNEYMNTPPITRIYTTACVITTLAVQLDLASPFQLYFNPILILKGQIWRLITTFLFFGSFGFNFFFTMIFTYKYCRMLEEGSFRNRSSDFLLMFLFGGTLMIIFAFFANLLYLGHAFTIMLVYIWSRRNLYLRMNFFGVLNFYAPYLPWVLVAFSVLLGNAVYVDLMGMTVGHLYYFLEDVFPKQRGGFRILKTPTILKVLFDEMPENSDYQRLPEDNPGGFDWGNQDNQQNENNH